MVGWIVAFCLIQSLKENVPDGRYKKLCVKKYTFQSNSL